jgi:hypothetical protein
VIPLKIYDLFIWQQEGEIPKNIPFETKHKSDSCQEKICLVKLHRVANRVCDIRDDYTFQNKHGKPDKYDKGISWIKIGSHAFKINEQHRIIIREK